MTEEHKQLTREDLTSMSTQDIAEAHSQGRLNELMGIPIPTAVPERPTRDDLKSMTNDQISQALTEGRLNHVMNPVTARAEAARTDTTSGADSGEEITEPQNEANETNKENNE